MSGKNPPGRATAQAVDVAIQGLVWLASEQARIEPFLAQSGASVEDLRKASTDPAFLSFVLDFILSDDAMVAAFCADAGFKTDAPERARAALPGGDLPNWT